MIGIYKITSPSGKVYIGQSCDIERRRKEHKRECGTKQVALHRSFKKHGFENHEFKIICDLPNDISQSVLDNMERAYIEGYKAAGFTLLNIKEGGMGGKHSESSKQRISEIRKGMKFNDEHKKNLSIAHKGIFPSIESKIKRSQSISGVKHWGTKRIKNIVTNECWGTIKEAANKNMMHPSTLAKALRGERPNTTKLRYDL